MLNKLFGNFSEKNQGYIALFGGVILLLGLAGKIQLLESMLNMIIMVVAVILLLWGLNKSNVYAQIKNLVK